MFLLRAVRRSGCNRRGIFFHGHSHLEERAVILRALLHDRFRNRLGALELRASVKIHALFAAMEFVPAPRTRPVRTESRRQHVAAATASRPQHGSHHARRSRTNLLWTRTARLLGCSLALFWLAARVLIPVLFVFSIQPALTTLRSSARTTRLRGPTGLRAAVKGDTSRIVKLLNSARPWYLSAEILTGSTQR